MEEIHTDEMELHTGYVPVMNIDEEKELLNIPLPENIGILSLKNLVLFPGMVIPITAGRKKSIQLIEEAKKNNELIGVVCQIDESVETPEINDFYHVGTVARVLKIMKMPNGHITALLQGQRRFKATKFTHTSPYFRANIVGIDDKMPKNNDAEYEVIIETIRETAENIIIENPEIHKDAVTMIKNIESHTLLINFISTNLEIPTAEKQNLLSILPFKKRAIETLRFMNVELQKSILKNRIHSKVRSELDQQQKEYFLNQQIKTIQTELGGNSTDQDIYELKKRAETKKWNEDVKNHFDKELAKMQRINPQSPDYSILRNYLDLMLDLPWDEFSVDNFDLKNAKQILDRDHFGIDDVKKRILEHMAVLKLRNDMKSPILCLYGPPGVGKTSVGRSIADALGREYVRFSLGGLRDEAEIRGHRKTYVGAMPGRILQNLKKAKTSNPVFVLDEIDKLSSSYNGDPSSALLEVLDPEQNKQFYDNFLEIGYDLSKVMFIATSNSLNTMQPALLDRMEIIEMNGYTIEEKVEIAKRHLLPKQLKEHGLDASAVKLTKKQFEHLITTYTRESGVRNLDKQLAALARGIAFKLVMNEKLDDQLSDLQIEEMLGAPKFDIDKYENNESAGVVTGLAWTRVGGDILYIESILSEGKGTLTMTGNLGNVMKESATIALEYIKANAQKFDIDSAIFEKYKVHVHVPEGATPKDGPSAGVAMLTSIVSSLTQKRVKKNLAMTGEITLRGKVLPVGGIKEKILAAKRANIKEIILCHQNKKDIDQINADYVKGLTFHYVDTMQEVIDLAITNQNVKNMRKLLVK